MVWDALKISKSLVKAALEMGFEHPTLVQQRCIPLILGGQKVIGIAQTGTGKTAAYLLPLLTKLNYTKAMAPRALVLAPTKELVMQIGLHAKELAKHTDLKIVELFGGVGPKGQIELLNAGADLLIATPGRFLEIYLRGEIKVKSIMALVIDEADRMMDMNFMPQIRKVFEVLPPKRQNLLFSATFPPRVEKMAMEFIDFPVKVEITPQSSASVQVRQVVYKTANFKTKLNLLLHFLKDPEFSRVMVFARRKETVGNLTKYLDRINVGAARAIHSNKGQNTRINSLREFREGKVRILVSTEVAARGIDVEKVSHVVNFDVPMIYEDYVHRIGRTGRAFQTGVAITFVTAADVYHIGRIEAMINERIRVAKFPEEVEIEVTPFEESQKIALEIDIQKRRADPTFQGAFHARKG